MSNALTFELNKTSEWRARKAERHPEDPRNQDAVTRLNELAEQNPIGGEDVFNVLDEMETDVDNPYFAEMPAARSEVLQSIGFGFEPETVAEVAVAIVRRFRDYPSIDDLTRVNKNRVERDMAATAAGKTAN